ncbi:hypothetical protein ACYSNR_18225 [Enterococcus sp. LJL128]
MSVLDMSFIGLLSSAILFLLFSFLYLFVSLSTGKKIKALKGRKVKNKKKRKKLIRARKKLEKKRKNQLMGVVICLLVGVSSGAGAFYARYYQLTNLTADDASALAKSYYLIDEMDKQLESVENGAGAEKTVKNLKDLTSQLGSVTVRIASEGLSEDGQKLLNRHFSMLKNLAVNISTLSSENLENAEKRGEYRSDIEKVKEHEQKVFKNFGINESSLKQK